MPKIKLTKEQSQYLGIALAALAGLGYVYVAFFWIPISRRIALYRKQIQETDAKIKTASMDALRLPLLRKELAGYQAKEERARAELPDRSRVGSILTGVSRLCGDYGVALETFSQGVEKRQKDFTEIDYGLKLRGPLHGIGRLTAALALQERIYSAANLSLNGPPGKDGALSASMTLVAYEHSAASPPKHPGGAR